MNPFSVFCLLLFFSTFAVAYSPPESPQQSLNQYVAFLNKSVDVLTRRFQMVQAYQADVNRYRQKPDFELTLPSSGPLADYEYRKALAGNGLTPAEKQRLTAPAQALWQLLTQLDQMGKALETSVRLKTYQTDGLNQSDALIGEMLTLFGLFSRDKALFYQQIERVYRRYQPYLPTDPYLTTEKEMAQALLSQQQLLDSLPCYLHEDSRADWPVALVQRSITADEKILSTFGKAQTAIDYPATSSVNAFKTDLLTIQAVKRRAVDDHTFAARQSARHGNAVYLSLMKHYNQGLLASHRAFVNDSRSARRLLDYPAFSPVVTAELPPSTPHITTPIAPFQDRPPVAFTVKRATSPIPRTTFLALNGYVDFINESLRQMRTLQVLLRDYQASAEYHRDPVRSGQRANLTYSHEAYVMPVSAYQLLLSASRSIPVPCRTAVIDQAEVLMSMIREMDGLSIELIRYSTEKQYLRDRLERSDAILDRYAYLFDTFDRKKEQLYADIRRIHESYPIPNPISSWHVAGRALLKTLDDDRAILFGVKAFLTGELAQPPATDKLEADARQLVADEYQNLNGLPRYGRSDGLCPYSPYEDLADNSLRFAPMAQKVKPVSSGSTAHPYESFYYFYNNELVYQYNKFSELAPVGLLKAINQPNAFAFRRPSPSKFSTPIPIKVEPTANERVVIAKPVTVNAGHDKPTGDVVGQVTPRNDTVYVERIRVDTVYRERSEPGDVNPSLAGYAANNMVLLLDVSGSMDSPIKLPLLKRSIKALLPLLRPEDQISIVVYSGKARVVLKPTSGVNRAEIARVIDELESTGDTDGNKGLQLAYKWANKHYLRGGNNRIILATDGEFSVSDDTRELIGQSALQDVFLTVLTFGRNPLTGQNLKKLSLLGRSTYAHVTPESADLQLILEAQAKKLSAK